MAKTDFSAAHLRELLTYEPDLGVLCWRTHRRLGWVGREVSCDSERGYLRFRIGRTGFEFIGRLGQS